MSTAARRSAPAGAGPRRPAHRRRAPAKRALGDRIVDALPISHDTLRRMTTWGLLGIGGAAAFALASWTGLLAAAGDEAAEIAARAGLRVEQVDITGLHRMDRETVYAVALENQPTRAMLRIDLDAVRQRLLRYGWVADAYVSRRMPDRLVIHIVERTPAAVWQDSGRLTLIDADGHLLEPVDQAAMPDLPLVIGPGADQQEAGYTKLLAAAPALKKKVRAASWVGNRRWDVTFDTGEVLALPEDGAEAALRRFARLNGARSLLGQGWVRFDMRVPHRMYARRSGEDATRIEDDGTGGVDAGDREGEAAATKDADTTRTDGDPHAADA